jgi:hypothetical protein
MEPLVAGGALRYGARPGTSPCPTASARSRPISISSTTGRVAHQRRPPGDPAARAPDGGLHHRYLDTLRSLGVPGELRHPQPNEVVNPIPFDTDQMHASYDAGASGRRRALVQADRVLKEFRGRFIGKCSPVHFWWGRSICRAIASTVARHRHTRGHSQPA